MNPKVHSGFVWISRHDSDTRAQPRAKSPRFGPLDPEKPRNLEKSRISHSAEFDIVHKSDALKMAHDALGTSTSKKVFAPVAAAEKARNSKLYQTAKL